MRDVVILGATGSIGTQTLDVVRRLPERLCVVGLSAFRNADLLKRQAAEFDVPAQALALGDDEDELVRLASLPGADVVVMAVPGAMGTRATLAALEAGRDVALATKQVLVSAGPVVMETARRTGTRLLPIDSEHSAIFQCVQGSPAGSVRKLWITGSGGPFRTWSREQMDSATVADALHHPTWPNMGAQNTTDSATLMNKALEMIEAHYLFGVPAEDIHVVIHPQSVVHSLVEFTDGSVLAQMGVPDMRGPIQYALLFPERPDTHLPRLNVTQMPALIFEPPDEDRFPALSLARRALSGGGTLPAVLNAANEAAVALFLDGRLRFSGIVETVARVMDRHVPVPSPTLARIREADRWARQETQSFAMKASL